jgi:uncharacterized protein
MKSKLLTYSLCIMSFLWLSGFSQESNSALDAELAAERKAQDNLPKSKDPMWNVLAKTKTSLDKVKWHYSAEHPEEIKALVGKEVTISGFMLPLEATEKFKHFIISKRTPTCGFCPPGEPNEIVEVFMTDPVSWDEDTIKVKGTFELVNNAQLGLFFKLSNAQKIK